MNGEVTIRQLLAADIDVTEFVDPDAVPSRIVVGELGKGAVLPAIQIEEISSVDRNLMNPGAKRRVRDRVQVTVVATTRAELRAVLRAVKAACADQAPVVAGITDVTVHTDGAGPFFTDAEASIRMRSQDFIVSYNETR